MRTLKGEKRFYMLINSRWVRVYPASYHHFTTKKHPNILHHIDNNDVKSKMF